MAKKRYAFVIRDEQWLKVRIMAEAEGYAMVRFPGCMPFIIPTKELKYEELAT